MIISHSWSNHKYQKTEIIDFSACYNQIQLLDMEPVANWEEQYQQNDDRWDIGKVSTPLKEYFDQLINKNLKILIPGGGNGHEATYLHQQGFTQVYLLDVAPTPLKQFAERNPNFDKQHLLLENFFDHDSSYDLVVEQTFFCAINPTHRKAYARKVSNLLNPNGKLVGLLWSVDLNTDHPPYGGSKSEYRAYFDEYFSYLYFDNARNSIKPRANRELFLLAQKQAI